MEEGANINKLELAVVSVVLIVVFLSGSLVSDTYTGNPIFDKIFGKVAKKIEICMDKKDNDNDKFIDCKDFDCRNYVACKSVVKGKETPRKIYKIGGFGTPTMQTPGVYGEDPKPKHPCVADQDVCHKTCDDIHTDCGVRRTSDPRGYCDKRWINCVDICDKEAKECCKEVGGC